MKYIHLTKGARAVVDDRDYEEVSKHKWTLTSHGYAARRKNRAVNYLHRQIMEAGSGQLVDHVNGDKLDNRRANLRLCSLSENGYNRHQTRRHSSRYRGVYRQRRINQWSAQVTVNKKKVWIGNFRNERHAMLAVSMWNLHIAGEFANPEVRPVCYG